MENGKLKIGLFNECFPPIQDGVSQVVENYARLLHERGNDVTVATAKIPFFDYPQTYHVKNIASIPVLPRLPYRVGLPIWMVPVQPIMRFKADIMHLHSPFTAGRIALKLGKKNHVPVVATFHSKYRDDFKHSVKSDTITDFMLKHIMEVFEQADEVWVPQESVIDVMRSYGYKGPVEVVSNAIDYDVHKLNYNILRQQARTMHGIEDNTPCFLFVGQITKEKRVDYILRVLAELKKKNYKFRAYFVGKGYWADNLRIGIIQNRLRDCVEYKGQISDRSALQLFYAAADLFLFPSLYDTFGLVIREAAAHHTPSVLMSDALCAKGLTDRVNGYIIDECTPDVYADKIIEFMSNTEIYNKISECASTTLCKTWDQLMPEVEDRYKSLIRRYNQ